MVVLLAKECENDCESQADQNLNSRKVEIIKTKLSHLQKDIAEVIYTNLD